MKLNTQLILSSSAALLLSGCSSITETLDRGRQAMVKMPVAVEPGLGRQRRAHGVVFQQAFAAPTLGKPATWFLAWRENGKPLIEGPDRGLDYLSDAAFAAWHRYPILIEENFTFRTTGRRFGKPETKTGTPFLGEYASDGPGSRVEATARPSIVWPYKMTNADVADWKRRHPNEPVPAFDPLWHLGDAYTQLRSARNEARLQRGEKRILIGHLDNGFTLNHNAAPAYMLPDTKVANATGLADAVERGTLGAHPSPGQTQGSHGTGSLGILAGRKVEMAPTTLRGVSIGGIHEPIGGAPDAEVVSIRVAPWVGSLSSAEMAYGIDLASRVHGCQVISMSHGGLPTVAWADAINAAYDRGTAIFAAEADFFSLVPRPLYPFAFIWPSSPVWPAAFRRVVGVTGVQKDGTPYAKGGLFPLTGFMRGSYGADGTRNFGILSETREDEQVVKYAGRLRAHPIAAYAPNVVWPSVRNNKETKEQTSDGLDFDGGGTSAATPQVAAAAALWLQKHRAGFTAAEWNSWRRAEAVYFALIKAADRTASHGKPDLYVGAGTLKAKDALAITPRMAMAAVQGQPGSEADLFFPKITRGKPRVNYGMQLDYSDGERSLGAFLGSKLTRKKPPNRDRENLDENTWPGESRADALRRIHSNDLLIQQWKQGYIPVKDKTKEP